MTTDRFPLLPAALGLAFEADDPSVAAKDHERTHVESVQRQVAALGAGNIDAYLAELDPDVELEIHCPPVLPFVTHARGLPGLREAVAANFASLEDQAPEVLHLVAQGDVVDMTIVETGRVKAAQTPYRIIGVLQFLFRNHRVVRMREILSEYAPAAVQD